jgi:hypothetical protein
MQPSQQLAIIVQTELKRRDWQLADEPALFASGVTFVEKVWGRVQEQPTEENSSADLEFIRHAIVNEYCYLLYAALRSEGHIQNRAQEELIAYTWKYALERCQQREWAEEAILKSLENIWRRIDSIRDPGALLAIFVQDLRWEIGHILKKNRQIAHREQTESDLSLPGDEDSIDFSPLEFLANSKRHHPMWAELERCLHGPTLVSSLQRCLKDWKKTFTIIAEFCIELNANEIAWLLSAAQPGLNVQARHVNTYKFRALEKLRQRQCHDAVDELTLCVHR